jgi:thimet oligopeptidase
MTVLTHKPGHKPGKVWRSQAVRGAFAALWVCAAATAPSAHGKTQAPAPKASAAALPMPTTMPGPAFPNFETALQIETACQAGLRDAKARVAELERRKADLAWLVAFDDLNGFVEDVANPIMFVGNVHPTQVVRDAAQACELKWQDFSSTLLQNATLFKQLSGIRTKDEIDTRFKRLSMEGFEDAGVSLPPAKRERAKAISDKVSALALDFEKTIRDSNFKVAFRASELAGVPEDVLARAKRDESGVILLGLDYPTYLPVMQYAEDGLSRERMWRAKQNEGGDGNLALLAQISQLRKEYAQLFGLDNYADFIIRRRMAVSASRANAFLDDLRNVVEEGERQEIVQLREAKALHLNQPNAKLERWDADFYSERIKRERFSVDQNTFRQYFPPQESLRFVMGIAERMFNIKYTKVDAKLWHPEVQAYAVTEAGTNKPLAALTVDLYPREGKYNHAAVWGNRGSATRDVKGVPAADRRVSQAALVVNFDRKGLSLDELETLLHEFGHALHNNLSSTRYIGMAGTSVQRDFVEAPSQMLEDWVYDPKVLATFKTVCPTCKPVPPELVAQALKARDYGKARLYSRQHLYASFDLAVHSKDAPDPMSAWAKMEGATPLGHVKGTKFPAGFGHIASGYAAGYYGYLWSEVVARDLRTAFVGDKLSPTIGMRYRNIVLGNGAQQAPQALVKQFLGRDTNSKAFFEYLRK